MADGVALMSRCFCGILACIGFPEACRGKVVDFEVGTQDVSEASQVAEIPDDLLATGGSWKLRILGISGKPTMDMPGFRRVPPSFRPTEARPRGCRTKFDRRRAKRVTQGIACVGG